MCIANASDIQQAASTQYQQTANQQQIQQPQYQQIVVQNYPQATQQLLVRLCFVFFLIKSC